jgi:PKD repeat protein
VNHSVTNAAGTAWKNVTSYITATNPPPVASFNANVSSGTVPFTVEFNDTSTGTGIISWSWDFADGGTATTQNATHTFTTAGSYLVNLTVANDGGSSWFMRTITVDQETSQNIPYIQLV